MSFNIIDGTNNILSTLYVNSGALSAIEFGGPTGPTGPQGSQGPQGSTGPIGPAGTGLASVGNNFGEYLYWNTGTNSWVTGGDPIKIGINAGQINQLSNSIAIGYQAGQINQLSNSIAIGYQAGQTFQTSNAIAIGYAAGQNNQRDHTIAMGYEAGQTNQLEYTIALGFSSGQSGQKPYSVAIGYQAGITNQNSYNVAVGARAGFNQYGCNNIAIGNDSGYFQSSNNIAIGNNSGLCNSNTSFSISIGDYAGNSNQKNESIAIGKDSGRNFLGTNSIAIGSSAGFTGSGNNSILIGPYAGFASSSSNCTILNASGTGLNSTTPGFFVNPIRGVTGVIGLNNLYYNSTNSEISFQSPTYAAISNNSIGNTYISSGTVISYNYVWSFGFSKQNINNISFNSSTNLFTIQIPGVYQIMYTIQNAANPNWNVALRKGVIDYATSILVLGGGFASQIIVDNLLAGDIISLVLTSNTTASTLTAYSASLSILKIA